MAGPLKDGDPILWACVQAVSAVTCLLGVPAFIAWCFGLLH